MQLEEPYAPRWVRHLEVWNHGDWRLKLYGIAYQGDAPGRDLVDSAKQEATARLPAPAHTPRRYGVGFMGVHEGRGANLMFLDWWADENELHHHACVTGPAPPYAWHYVTPTGLAACVWDLAVICFERRAWIDTVLAAAAPDPEAYLRAIYSGSI